MKIGERIKKRRKELGMSVDDLAKRIGKDRSTIYRYESDDIENLPVTVLEPIAKALRVEPAELLGWTKPSNFSQTNLGGIAVSPIKKRTFPLLGEIACGEPITANENLEVYVDAGADIEADFCLRAKGDSMSGARIYDGDIVFIRKQSMVDNGEIAAVIIDNEATLKRVNYYPQKNLLILKSENPKYEDFIFTDEQLENISIIGKAVFFQSIVK